MLFGKSTNSMTADSKIKIRENTFTQINASNDSVVRTVEEVKRNGPIG